MRGYGLNQWMGMARAPSWGRAANISAPIVENLIRVAIPGSIAAGAYGGYRLGTELFYGDDD